MTPSELAKAREKFPLSQDVIKRSMYANQPCRTLPDPEPQCDQAPALDAAVSGEKDSVGRICVCFIGYRVRPLDPDNFAASVKDLLDGVRHSGLIPGDEAWRIRLQTEQEQVAHFKDERTEITITYQ